jgi:hypothetical protein
MSVIIAACRIRQTEAAELFVEEGGRAIFVEKYTDLPSYQVLEKRVKDWAQLRP